LGHDFVGAFSSTNAGVVGSLLSIDLARGHRRVLSANYEGIDLVLHCFRPPKGKRNLITAGTIYKVGSTGHVSAAENQSPVIVSAWRQSDVSHLSKLPKACLVDLASRLGLPPVGDQTSLAYSISGRRELPSLGASSSHANSFDSASSSSSSATAAAPPDLFSSQLASMPVLESLSAGDVISVWFDENERWYEATVVDVDPDWDHPYGVEIPGDSEIYWISLDEGVKLLDESGSVMAATPDVLNASSVTGAAPMPVAELEEDSYHDDMSAIGSWQDVLGVTTKDPRYIKQGWYLG
jgi:hypothetical protein